MPDIKSRWQPKAKTERTVVFVLILIAIASVVAVIVFRPGLVTFWPFTVAEFIQLVTPLFLVALFIERVLEVFLTSWRAGGARVVENQAKTTAEEATTTEAVEKKVIAEEEVIDYKSRTQRIAFIAGTAIGVAVSALGIRVLELLVDPAVFGALPQAQRSAFAVADVLLTGALLGGGADALHQLVKVFTNFMESAGKMAKERGEQ